MEFNLIHVSTHHWPASGCHHHSLPCQSQRFVSNTHRYGATEGCSCCFEAIWGHHKRGTDKHVSISKITPLARSLLHLTTGTDKDITLVTELTAQSRCRFKRVLTCWPFPLCLTLVLRSWPSVILGQYSSGLSRRWQGLCLQIHSHLVVIQSTNKEKTGLWDIFDAKVAESYTHRTGTTSATL